MLEELPTLLWPTQILLIYPDQAETVEHNNIPSKR